MKSENFDNEVEKEAPVVADVFVEEEDAVEVSGYSSISTYGCMSGCASTASTWIPG
jgi:hypothetical protein